MKNFYSVSLIIIISCLVFVSCKNDNSPVLTGPKPIYLILQDSLGRTIDTTFIQYEGRKIALCYNLFGRVSYKYSGNTMIETSYSNGQILGYSVHTFNGSNQLIKTEKYIYPTPGSKPILYSKLINTYSSDETYINNYTEYWVTLNGKILTSTSTIKNTYDSNGNIIGVTTITDNTTLKNTKTFDNKNGIFKGVDLTHFNSTWGLLDGINDNSINNVLTGVQTNSVHPTDIYSFAVFYTYNALNYPYSEINSLDTEKYKELFVYE
jgi:YD repeat-containing protein